MMKNIEELLRMTERPQDFSDEEIQQMMSDPDMRAYYELMVSAEAGFAQRKKNHGDSPHDLRFAANTRTVPLILRIAAMFIGVLLLSGFAFAAWHFTQGDSERAAIPAQSQESVIMPRQQGATEANQVRTFENVELQQILQELSDYYQVGVVFHNERSRHIRIYTKWDTTAPLHQMIERLNGFEKVNIRLTDDKIIAE
ncbi:MAG: DUF4974 domain-containing protein [Prevotella sp.]|nr:DUF4974 domain-containing protein [Prevotella sp.]